MEKLMLISELAKNGGEEENPADVRDFLVAIVDVIATCNGFNHCSSALL